jgi:hypothetical protein
MVAESLGIPIEQAFALMRSFARARQERIGVVADLLTARRIKPAVLLPHEESDPLPLG